MANEAFFGCERMKNGAATLAEPLPNNLCRDGSEIGLTFTTQMWPEAISTCRLSRFTPHHVYYFSGSS